MKKHLLIKTSSMGDILHTLPALTDAGRLDPDVRFDWVVEEAFAEIPAWHPCVDRVIPIAWRRWRHAPLRMWQDPVWHHFYQSLRATEYDKVIDAQGLMKSAIVMRLSRGIRCGFDYRSAREGCASFAAQRRYAVSRDQHAVMRTRVLFSRALGYELPDPDSFDYGLKVEPSKSATDQVAASVAPNILFIHGTSRANKCWPESHWIALGRLCLDAGCAVKLLWGSAEEYQRSLRIASACPGLEVLQRLSLLKITEQLASAQAAVAVDTGLGHMAAAFALPTVSLYGPTDPRYAGALGKHQVHITIPAEVKRSQKKECMSQIAPQTVFAYLQECLIKVT